MYFHVNGNLVPEEDATVSVRDRGFMYGDAAFETLRAYGGEVFEWEAHADRLRRTCKTLALDHGIDDDELLARIHETLEANDLADAYVKLSISRGVQPGKLTPKPDVDPTVVVMVNELPRGGTSGMPVWDDPATVQTVKTRRIPNEAIPAGAKTHNYLNGILARLELRRASSDTYQPDEALIRDTDGNIAEGATSNVFFVIDNALRTPATTGPVLPGVTRDVVLKLAREEGIPVEEGSYTPDQIRRADEAFLTNTTWELRPIESVDGMQVGGGPVTDLLSLVFKEYVEERHYQS